MIIKNDVNNQWVSKTINKIVEYMITEDGVS